ncbi:ATP-binding protein [Lutimonas halocynthiae]|uniref:ATP-binding protein n=1 Tax=Lutimonas halocynthiae TaxID=1446477 RepID=UPI0025B4F604|nr:ATP-binding protein [Lutimonas halocynthiae]MDN3643168.1 ATP-binding protein [Lutimonas halocynthiae]
MYTRTLFNTINTKIGSGKAIILIGPRQVGKTTLIRNLIEDKKHLFLDADDPTVRSILNNPNTEQIRSIIGSNKIVFIDQAQRISGIGLTLKIITDQFKDVQLLVSGSSSFDLSRELNEPLTGRKWEYELYPISWKEFEDYHGYLISEQQLENRLLYGLYPDVLNNPGEEKEILKQLVSSYLYRDILAYSNIRKPEVLEKLVQALALQIGSEVNYNELAQIVGVDKNTVSSYIDILQKGYVIFKLDSFSRNLRTEIKKNKKIYFYDNGIRNMVLGNFNSLDLRSDTGALWENFLISERLKQNTYKNKFTKMYFWRTKQQQEVDLVEEVDGIITGFEFKWNAKKKIRLPKTFVNEYNANEELINRNNFRKFVSE